MRAPDRKLRTFRNLLLRTLEYKWLSKPHDGGVAGWFRVLTCHDNVRPVVYEIPLTPWEVGHIFAAIWEDAAGTRGGPYYLDDKFDFALTQSSEWHDFAHEGEGR